MNKYSVIIEETVIQEFTVKAMTAVQAMEIARLKYLRGDFIVDDGEVHAVAIKSVNVKDKTDFTGFVNI